MPLHAQADPRRQTAASARRLEPHLHDGQRPLSDGRSPVLHPGGAAAGGAGGARPRRRRTRRTGRGNRGRSSRRRARGPRCLCDHAAGAGVGHRRVRTGRRLLVVRPRDRPGRRGEGGGTRSPHPAHQALRRRPAAGVPRPAARRHQHRDLRRRGGRRLDRPGGHPERLSLHGRRQRDRVRLLGGDPDPAAVRRARTRDGRPPMARPAGPSLPLADRSRRRDGHPVQGAHRGPSALARRRHHRAALAHLRHDAHRHSHRRRLSGTGRTRCRLSRGRGTCLPSGGRGLPRRLRADLARGGDCGMGRHGTAHHGRGRPHGRRTVARGGRLRGVLRARPTARHRPVPRGVRSGGRAWRRRSARGCSSRCASPGAAPAGTSWAHCSCSPAWRRRPQSAWHYDTSSPNRLMPSACCSGAARRSCRRPGPRSSRGRPSA